LLFFHHVGWDDPLDTGRSVWEELVHRYSQGVDEVQGIRDQWQAAAAGRIDRARFTEMTEFLQIQHWEARWWRDACLTYLAQVNGKAIPPGYAAPHNALSFYRGLSCPTNRDKPRSQQVYDVEASPAVLP
jgi:alpha-glucuronidase